MSKETYTDDSDADAAGAPYASADSDKASLPLWERTGSVYFSLCFPRLHTWRRARPSQPLFPTRTRASKSYSLR